MNTAGALNEPECVRASGPGKPFSYHSTAKSAIEALGQRLVRESKAATLTEAVADVNRIAATLSQALTPKIEIEGGGDE